MGLDIKIPIGLMFVIFGIILTIFGLATIGNEMYELSVGRNINLYSGIGMLIFGGFMLIISDLKFKKKITESLGVDEEELKEEVREELNN
jgi:amino acid transporter